MTRHRLIAGEFRHLRGWRPGYEDLTVPSYASSARHYPQRADLRSLPVPIRDQGAIGSCTANACAEAMGYLYLKRGLPDPLLSRLFIYWASRSAEGVAPTEDAGCVIGDVVRVLQHLGAPLEQTWPYVDDGVRFVDKPSEAAYEEARQHQLVKAYRVRSFDALRMSLADGYPVVGGFSCPPGIDSAECAKTGVVPFQPNEASVGGHAILFVGYDEAARLVTFQNSWGRRWGAAGYGFLPYDFFLRRLSSDWWTFRSEEQPEIPAIGMVA